MGRGFEINRESGSSAKTASERRCHRTKAELRLPSDRAAKLSLSLSFLHQRPGR
jgi:hypothetical protein